MARRAVSPTLMRLTKEAKIVDLISPKKRIGQLFDVAFDLLKIKSRRHEYIYKSALTQRVLLGTHSLQTASMLTEFRVGKCKADMVILNGTATAYEIKTERDSLSRLSRQISSYRDVFAKVYVIAGENHVGSIYPSVPSDVGIMVLSNRHRISTLREAEHRPERTSALAIFDSLQLKEAVMVLRTLDVKIPDVPNTKLYSTIRSEFAKLEAATTHEAMVTVLKKTRHLLPLANLLEKLPKSLHTAALTVPLRTEDRERLLSAVNTRIGDALNWG